jgi:hypothetical protein
MLEIQFLVWDRHKDVRKFNLLMTSQPIAGVDPGVHPARAPPKIGKNMIFWLKIVIFHTK